MIFFAHNVRGVMSNGITVVFNKNSDEYNNNDIIGFHSMKTLIDRPNYNNITVMNIVSIPGVVIPRPPSSIQELTVESTDIGPCLSKSFNNLNYIRVLRIDNCDLKYARTLPNCIETLILTNCKIRYLANLPSNLKNLDCQNNKIYKIDALPDGLEKINCRDNSITELPDLPDSLESLNCYDNMIEYLPILPSKLKYLICDHNQIKLLPELPESLIYLDCSKNILIDLPKLPTNLSSLDCSYNKLTTLPVELPVELDAFYCNDNKLEEVPDSILNIKCVKNDMFMNNFCKKSITKLNRMTNPDIESNPVWHNFYTNNEEKIRHIRYSCGDTKVMKLTILKLFFDSLK